MSGQTKLISIIEALANVFVGATIAWCSTQFIAVPLLGLGISPGQNLLLTIFLTFVSIARGYIIRRLFNKHYLKSFEDLKTFGRKVRKKNAD